MKIAYLQAKGKTDATAGEMDRFGHYTLLFLRPYSQCKQIFEKLE